MAGRIYDGETYIEVEPTGDDGLVRVVSHDGYQTVQLLFSPRQARRISSALGDAAVVAAYLEIEVQIDDD